DEGFLAYVDEDADGRADVLQHVNSDGVVTDQARFSPDSGAWVPEQPQQHDNDLRPNGDSMVVDTPDGKRAVGPATEDTNNDGRPDTAIVPTANGTMLATDSDGDGTADQLVEITADGAVTVSQHSGGGEWTVLQQGERDSEGQFTASGADSTDDATWRFNQPEQQVADHAGTAEPANAPGAASAATSPAATSRAAAGLAVADTGTGEQDVSDPEASRAGASATDDADPAPRPFPLGLDSDAVWT